MYFSKRLENSQVCYTKPLDSLKNWNDNFFWVDASVLPHAIPWHTNKTLRKDPPPLATEYNANICDYLATNPAPFKKFLEPFLYFVGISWNYTLDEGCYPTFWDDEDEGGCLLLMDLFAFIHHEDPTKVKIGEREVREGEVLLLEMTRGRVVPLTGVNNQGGAAAQGVGDETTNKGSGGVATANQSEESSSIVRLDGIDIEVDAKAQALIADKPKKVASTSTSRKSLVALQDLLDKSTLATKIGVTATATVPFVTSFVTPTPEHEGGEYANSISRGNIQTKRPAERFVISSDTSHDSNANAIDDKVSSVFMSTVLDPVVLTTAIATTVVANTSIPQPKDVNEPTHASIFADSTFAGNVDPNVVGPSQAAGNDVSFESFYVLLDMDFEIRHQTYVSKWDVLNDSALDEPNVCRSLVDQLAPLVFFVQLHAMDYDQLFVEFNVGADRQSCLGTEVRMRLEHVLRGKKRLEGKCDIEAADATWTDSEIAKLTWDLSSLQLSYDDLSIKALTFECEKDKLFDQVLALVSHTFVFVMLLSYAIIILTLQVSELEVTCFGLRDEVTGYKLFKEHIKTMQNAQVKALSDRVAGMDANLMEMALHMDEEFYPCYLTTIARRRWVLSHDLKLVITKCMQSPEYMAALGGDFGRAIDKGMQDGLKAGVDHGRARRGLDVIAAYDPSAKANFVSAVDALRAVNFPLLAQLESKKDVSMADIIDLLRLEGPAAETPKANQFLIGEASTSRILASVITTVLYTTFVQTSTVPSEPSTEALLSPRIVVEEEELDTTPERASVP
ncbi:hypothetical protein Tco_1100059 [Tanacetum coccineum]